MKNETMRNLPRYTMEFTCYSIGRSGACDICHNGPVALYALKDHEPGDCKYCEKCAVRACKTREKLYRLSSGARVHRRTRPHRLPSYINHTA